MRQAGTIPDEQRAKKFADYLLTLGISTRLDQDTDGWTVWVHDERHIDQSRSELEDFLADPNDWRFADVSNEAEQIRRDNANREKEYRKNVVDVRRKWSRGIAGMPPATLVVLVLMVLATVASDRGRNLPVSKWLFISSYNIIDVATGEVVEYLPEIRKGQLWRLVTPIFMHGSIIHLVFGLYMFFQFGRLIELRRGMWRFIGLILVIAVISNVAEFYLADFKDWPRVGVIDPSGAFLGMSGVIYGLFGYAWIRGRYDPTSGLQLHQQTVFILMIWLLVCLFGFLPIANVAHVAGLLVGMAIGYSPVFFQRLGI